MTMAKLRTITTVEERHQNIDPKRYYFKCPGCGQGHVISTVKREGEHAWQFNGNIDKPTFTPSLLVTCGHYVQGQPQPPNCEHCNEGHTCCYRCHSYITDGKIQFLSDCTHHLKGQTVELPDIEL
jgi:hypothetical protein